MEFNEIIFGTEQYDQEVKLRQQILRGPLGLDIHEEDLDSETLQLHFGLFDEGDLKACVVILPFEDTQAKLRQMAVAEDLQGKGFGKILMEEVEKYLTETGFKEIELHARETAVGFYEKLGYEVCSEEFTEVNIPHFKMIKAI